MPAPIVARGLAELVQDGTARSIAWFAHPLVSAGSAELAIHPVTECDVGPTERRIALSGDLRSLYVARGAPTGRDSLIVTVVRGRPTLQVWGLRRDDPLYSRDFVDFATIEVPTPRAAATGDPVVLAFFSGREQIALAWNGSELEERRLTGE